MNRLQYKIIPLVILSLLLITIFLPTDCISSKSHADLHQHKFYNNKQQARDYQVNSSGRYSTDLAFNRSNYPIDLALYNLGIPAKSQNPAEAADLFIRTHAERFGFKQLNLNRQSVLVKESPVGTHVHLQQVYNNLPVYGAYYNISIDNNNNIRMLTANPVPNIQLTYLDPAINNYDAIETALNEIKCVGDFLANPVSTLIIYRDINAEDHLAYSVRFVCLDPLGDWEVIVNANNSNILEIIEHTCYIDGTGYIFNPDPLTTAEVDYGNDYIDDNDNDSDALNDERVLVTLNEIEENGDIYRLNGPYVTISDFEPPFIDPVEADDPDSFLFTRSESGFEDVNVYYHIDNVQRHLQELGFEDIQNGPIEADPHGVDGADNSHYLPWTNQLAFGEGGVDDAEDADIIIHEYGHAIQHDIVPDWNGGHTASMGEGFCDYWAGTFSARLSDYHDTWFANWDGHNPFWGGRVLDYDGVYPDNWTQDIYQNGEIWSSCLWNIRSEIGADEADAIIIQSHYFLGWGATVEDAAEALLLADELLFDSMYETEIAVACYEKGFIDYIPGGSSIDGLVIDLETENPLEGAEVYLDDVQITETNQFGSFLIEELDEGIYELRIEAFEYGPWTETIEIGINETYLVTARMGQPQAGADPDYFDLIIPVGAVLDTTLILSNTGNDTLEWSAHLRPVGVDPPDPWSTHTVIDLVTLTDDPAIYGVTVYDGNIVVAGSNPGNASNMLYIIDSAGNMVDILDQPSVTETGFRDLATDGNLLYGCGEGWLVGFNLDGEVLDSIPEPVIDTRGLAFSPGEDLFWCANGTLSIVAVDYDGDAVYEFENDLNIMSLSWFPFDVKGMYLYAASVEGQPGNYETTISRFSHETGMAETIQVFESADPYDFPFGFDVSNRLTGLEEYWVALTTLTNLPNQSAQLNIDLLDTSVPWLNIQPNFGELGTNEGAAANLMFDAGMLEPGLYQCNIDINHNGYYSPLGIMIDLNVHAVNIEKSPAESFDYTVSNAYPNPFNSSTRWSVSLQRNNNIEVAIYDILGRLADRMTYSFSAGTNEISWERPAGLSSGVYFVEFRNSSGQKLSFQKILLLH